METEYGERLMGINEKYGEEILVETRVDTSERGGVTKVLSLEAEVKQAGVELLEKEAEVSGKVNYRLLYLDGQDRLCGLDYFKDFKCRVRGEEIAPNGKWSLSFTVPDADARIENDAADLSAVVEISLRYFGEREEKVLSKVGEAECRRVDILTECVKKSERIVDLDKIADSVSNVKKIVLFSAEALPVSVGTKEDGVEVSGELRATVVYLNEADEAVELRTEIPFSERYEAKGSASYDVAVKNARIILTDDEGGNSIEIEAALTLTETIYEERSLEVLSAVCGDKCEIEETVRKITCRRFVGRRSFEETLSGRIPLDAEGAFVLFVRPGCRALANVTVSDGVVKVEGVSAFRAIYLTEEGYGAAQGELPFVCAFPFEGAREGMEADVVVSITDVKAVGGKEVALTAKLSAEITLYDPTVRSYLSDVKEGTPYPESEAGVSVYFAEKGEDLWRIAKAMRVLPSVLAKANPFLESPLEETRKVLVFRGK